MLKTADMTCTYLLKRVILKTWSRPGDQALQYPDNNWKWLTFIYSLTLSLETHERRQGPIAGQTIMVMCMCMQCSSCKLGHENRLFSALALIEGFAVQ